MRRYNVYKEGKMFAKELKRAKVMEITKAGDTFLTNLIPNERMPKNGYEVELVGESECNYNSNFSDEWLQNFKREWDTARLLLRRKCGCAR